MGFIAIVIFCCVKTCYYDSYDFRMSVLEKAKSPEKKQRAFDSMRPTVGVGLENSIGNILSKHKEESGLVRGYVAIMGVKDGRVSAMVEMEEDGTMDIVSPESPRPVDARPICLGESFYMVAACVLAENGYQSEMERILSAGNRDDMDSLIRVFCQEKDSAAFFSRVSDVLMDGTSSSVAEAARFRTAPGNILHFCTALFDKEGKGLTPTLFSIQPQRKDKEPLVSIPESLRDQLFYSNNWKKALTCEKQSTVIRYFNKTQSWILISAEFEEPREEGENSILNDLLEVFQEPKEPLGQRLRRMAR